MCLCVCFCTESSRPRRRRTLVRPRVRVRMFLYRGISPAASAPAAAGLLLRRLHDCSRATAAAGLLHDCSKPDRRLHDFFSRAYNSKGNGGQGAPFKTVAR